MIADHKRDLAMLKQCSDKFNDDSQIAGLIQDHRATVQRHLKSTQNAARAIGLETRERPRICGHFRKRRAGAKDTLGREGGGEILSLPSNSDGTILGVIPAPSRKVETGNQSESYTSEELADEKVDNDVENLLKADQNTVVAPSTSDEK